MKGQLFMWGNDEGLTDEFSPFGSGEVETQDNSRFLTFAFISSPYPRPFFVGEKGDVHRARDMSMGEFRRSSYVYHGQVPCPFFKFFYGDAVSHCKCAKIPIFTV